MGEAFVTACQGPNVVCVRPTEEKEVPKNGTEKYAEKWRRRAEFCSLQTVFENIYLN